MPVSSAAVRTGIRVGIGVLGLAVAAASILAASRIPLPSADAAAPGLTVTPAPTQQQRVCPGPLLGLAEDSTEATTASSFGAARLTDGAAPGKPRPEKANLKAPDDGSGSEHGVPVQLTVPAGSSATRAPLIAGAQSQSADLQDLTGLAAAGCGAAAGDSWLVAGATSLGKTSLVMLSNPTDVTATVDLTVYGTQGAVKAPGATGIIVDPHTQRVIPLAGLAPDLAATVVHVQSRGGRVLASLQQSIVRGLEPGGVELAGPTAPPATHAVIPGVSVTTLTALRQNSSADGYSDALPAVRILIPGKKAATVSVGIANEKGGAAGSSTAVTVQPGVVTEIPLDKVADGDYTLTLNADQPFVAAARTSTLSGKARDFSWFEATGAFSGDFLASVAKGPGAMLHLANTGSADADVTVAAAHGKKRSVTVPAGEAVSVQVDDDTVYRISGARSIAASVSYTGSGLASAFALVPPGPLAGPITVYPR